MSLEECMEYIQSDECNIELHKSIRLRKNILDEDARKRVKQKHGFRDGVAVFKNILDPVVFSTGIFFYISEDLGHEQRV
jgi:hypothetical protein